MKFEKTAMQAMFGSCPQVKVLDVLLHHPDFEYNLTELTKQSGVSRVVVFELKDKLLHYGIIEHTKTVGCIKLYRFNKYSPAGKVLNNLSFKLASLDIDLLVNESQLKNNGGKII